MDCLQPKFVWVRVRKGLYAVDVVDSDLNFLDAHMRYDLEWRQILVRCGKCYTCREAFVRSKAQQAYAEFLSAPTKPLFCTLTYEDVNLPIGPKFSAVRSGVHPGVHPVLRYEHFRQFIRELRRDFPKVRFFGCGEYGPSTSRPHYHLVLYSGYPEGIDLFDVRESLLKYWRRGFVQVDFAVEKHFDYVASYVCKKSVETNSEMLPSAMPFVSGSKSPPLGYAFYHRYIGDIINKGYCQVQSRRLYPPRSFFVWLARHDSMNCDIMISQRRECAFENRLRPLSTVGDYIKMREHNWSVANVAKSVRSL